MKRTLSLILMMMIAYVGVMALYFPETFRQMEGNDYFLFTHEYLAWKLGDLPVIANIATDFLIQFFRWPFAGMLIEAILLGIVGLLTLMAFHLTKRKAAPEFALVLPLVLAVWFAHYVELWIEAIFFLSAICTYLSIKSENIRIACCLVLVPLSYMCSNFPIAILLMVTCVAIETFFHRTNKWWLPLLCLILLCFAPVAYSRNVAFIPFERRYFYFRAIQNDQIYCYIGTYVATILLALIPIPEPKKKLFTVLRDALASGLIIAAAATISTNQEMKDCERCFSYISMADNGEWQKLLNTCRENKEHEDGVKQRYALLAESALGTLPENLFHYRINTPDDFFYSHSDNHFAAQFNRQFYATLGVYDEAFHHAQEYYLRMINGCCFAQLKNAIDYSIREGEYEIAQKYLSVLDNALLYHGYVNDQRARMDSLQQKGIISKAPLRADNFVGGYPFNSEMVRLLQHYPSNEKPFLDYLLCGLLLQKNLPNFRIVLLRFDVYKGKTLPRAFAEAVSLIKSMGGTFTDGIDCNSETDEQLKQYIQDRDAGDVDLYIKYKGSFWNYYYFADIPAPNNNVQQSKGH